MRPMPDPPPVTRQTLSLTLNRLLIWKLALFDAGILDEGDVLEYLWELLSLELTLLGVANGNKKVL